MFSDPQFWVAVAFVAFIAAIFNPVRKILTSSLDAQIKDIRNKIDEAENLKNETQTTLSEIKKRQNDVQIEIQDIHKDAEKKVKQLEENDFQKEVFTNNPDLISNVLPDGELKLAMQRFEISRKKVLS